MLSLPPQFHVVIGSPAEEGLYNLNFHNCYNAIPGHERPFDITVRLLPLRSRGAPKPGLPLILFSSSR